jgi:signal peptidase I
MSEIEGPTRRVRPWIAALLTLLGWGVGFYYARQSRAAFWWAAASVLAGILLGVGVALYVYFNGAISRSLISMNTITWIDIIGWSLTLIIAIIAWRAAAQNKEVKRAGPGRLFGYVLIAVVPLLVSLCSAFAVRATSIQPFRAPAESMQPAIIPGDYFVVTKWSYGYSRYSAAPFESMFGHGRVLAREPQRGDIIVFRPRPEPERDFVKRLIGLPGDRIQMIDGVLHVNGAPVQRQQLEDVSLPDGYGGVQSIAAARETLPNGISYTTLDRGETELDNTRAFIVPDGHYFVLGDDRDNSADSRVPSVVGFIPYDNLIGRVDYIARAED